MLKYVAFALIVVGICDAGLAQRRRPGRIRPGGGVQIQRDSSDQNRRNDVEGAIWEFKVIDQSESNRSKQTKMTGRFRIKQTSVFAVGGVEMAGGAANDNRNAAQMMNEFDRNGDNKLDTTELDALLASMRGGNRAAPANPGNAQLGASGQGGGDLRNLVAQRLQGANEKESGGERIGDLTKSTSAEKTFRFDEDDNHPLSGIAVVEPDTERKNGVWKGRYDEYAGGKRTKRWRFEMRRIED